VIGPPVLAGCRQAADLRCTGGVPCIDLRCTRKENTRMACERLICRIERMERARLPSRALS
jgi:hypothetical protein